jgi:hypothetical protein
MAKLESRIQENARQYHGQSDAESLVNWLNVTEDLVGRARIIEVIDAFLRAIHLESETEPNVTHRKDGSAWVLMTPERQLVEAATKKLDRLLSYYTVVPNIAIPTSAQKGEATYWVSWRSAPGSKVERHSRTVPRPGPGRKWKKHYEIPGGQMGEIGALFNSLELIKSGLIAKIAGCRCGKFYFRKFAHQRFCSQKCKLAEFRTNEEVRTKRNEYARRLYHLHKSGKVK